MGGKRQKKEVEEGSREEAKWRVEITKKNDFLDKHKAAYNKLIEKYEQKYGPYEARLDDVVVVLPFSSLTDPSWAPRKLPTQLLPAHHPGCQICESRNADHFRLSKGICHVCERIANMKGDSEAECTGPILLHDQCVVHHGTTWNCVKCRLFLIKQKLEKKHTDFCSRIIVHERIIPESAQPGGMAVMMNLAEVNGEWFDRAQLSPGAETAAIIIRLMDFGATDLRTLSNVLLTVKLDDLRIATVYGLEQLSNYAKFLFTPKQNGAVLSTVYVEREMIEWSTTNPQNAATQFYCYGLADFLVNPLLNNDPRQSVVTNVSNLMINPSYFTLDCINKTLNKRGASLSWPQTEKDDDELNEILATWSRPITGSKGKKRKLDSSIQQKKFLGCIYVYISDTGMVYVGKHSGLAPRHHDSICPCEKCKYIEENRKTVEEYEQEKALGEENELGEVKIVKWYKTVLYYVEEKIEEGKRQKLEYYESMIQLLFAYAQLHGLSLSDVRLPFTELSTGFQQSWKDVDPPNLPDISITFLCSKIQGQNLSVEQLYLLKELSLIFFKREFDLDHDSANDYLRYSKS